MNPLISQLKTYPFTRLNQLLSDATPPAALSTISMHIGEPQHQPPAFVPEILSRGEGLGRYPSSHGTPELRGACANALRRRYKLDARVINQEQNVVPVNGTREGLFSFVQAVCGGKNSAVVVMPNPFYQIYEGAALLAGAEPYYLNAHATQSFAEQIKQVPASVWDRCELFFVCSPGNPDGHCLDLADWQALLKLSEQHDFVVAADECYADIYRTDQAPMGLIEACVASGHDDFERCAVFHSLSKRSNLPGLRSGFVVASETMVKYFRHYREYHGCAMSPAVQMASAAAWNDDQVPQQNRKLYDHKFAHCEEALAQVWPQQTPQGGFYVWANTPYDDQQFAYDLYSQQNLKILPGSFLARQQDGHNPGENRVRISLVSDIEQCTIAIQRIIEFFNQLN